MFGNTGNTSFGGFNTATQSSPFGQTGFGKPISTTTGFGAASTPAFGSNNTSLFSAKPGGTSTGGLFGNTTATPAFGQPATTQSSFGGFGANTANTSLFGTQQNANTSIFGSAGTTSAFGQTQKPGGFAFGSNTGTSLFGQPQQQVQQSTPFGQMNNTQNTSLFGNPGGFRAAATTSGMTGTGIVKFSPVTGTDTMVKNGATQNISTRHHCIICMKEYEGKSLEELRFEDYQAGLKGPQQPGQTPGLFGAAAQSSPFGNSGAITSTSTTGFGSMASGFGTNNQSTTSGGGLFGKPVTGFGTPATTATSAFAFNSTPSTGLFGSNTQNKPFGTAAPNTLFSNTSTNQNASGFGSLNNTQSTGFGFGSNQPNQSLGLFNQNKPAFSMTPATSNTGFGFGQTAPASTSNSLFGGSKPLGGTGFGTGTTGFGATATPAFGSTPGFGTATNTSTSMFNTSFKPATQTSGFSFGAAASTAPTLGNNSGLSLGGGTVGGTGVGVGGSSLFGQNKPGGLFGTPSSSTTFNSLGTFGNTSGFGTNTNTNTGLGMNLLGGTGGLGSSGLAGGVTNSIQQNSSSVPVHQQILALVSAPFGDSPLLKNLLPASGKAEEILKPTSNNRTLNNSQFKVSTTRSPKVKARVVTPAQLSKKSLFEGLEEEDPALLEAFQPRSNAKRLVLRPKPLVSSVTGTESPSNDNLNTNRNNESINETNEASSHSINSPEIEPVDKENYQGTRQSGDRRSSSTSWLRKKTLTRNIKMPEEEFDGQKSPFNSSEINDEALENTVTEFRNTAGSSSSKSQTNSPGNSQGGFDSNSPGTSTTAAAATSSATIADKSTNESAIFNDSSRDLDESALSSVFLPDGEIQQQNAAKVTLRRAGYYTIPPIDQLDDYVHGDTCIVPNFTIGRKGYGNVYFPDSFDIYGLNLDEIVYFRHKEVVIYPDDDKKPSIGQGLNRRAQVTLDRVWPQDKNLHEPITDPHRLVAMNYEGKLRRVSAKHEMRFLEYRPETGSWVFKVDHFSKYGLSDSDDEDCGEIPLDPNMKRLKAGEMPRNFLAPGRGAKKKSPAVLKQAQAMSGELLSMNNGVKRLHELNGEMMDMADEEMLNQSAAAAAAAVAGAMEKPSALSPTSIYARLTGTDSHKLQLMKASFFDTNDDYSDVSLYATETLLKPPFDIMKDKRANDSLNDVVPSSKMDNSRSNFTMHHDITSYGKLSRDSPSDVKQKMPEGGRNESSSKRLTKYLPAPVVSPSTVVLKFRCEVLPLTESISSKLNFQCIGDIGIQMGRKFKPSWGPGLTLLSLSTQEQASIVPLQNKFSQIDLYMTGRLHGDNTSTRIVQRLQILGGDGLDGDSVETFRESIEGHLRIQLNHCVIGQEGNCPWIRAGSGDAGLNALHDHSDLAEGFHTDNNNTDHLTSYANDVWKLCVALWGKLPSIEADSDIEKHENVMIRRDAFGDWLKEVVEATVQNEIAEIGNDEDRVLSLLSANKLEEACQVARKIGDYNLALLISQLGGTTSVRELIKQTIALWQATEVLNNISMNRLKVYMLAAGAHLIMCNDETVNVCERLDWKRALAIHLWYLSAPTASITDVLELYDNSFNAEPMEVYAAPPLPEYKEQDFDAEIIGGKMTYDLCYHLMKLYCTGNHSLNELLNPLTHTSDPLDYRLSWLLQQVIVGLGYSHLSDQAAAMTHTNFATQLEAHGLWHWAIFVNLHLNDTGIRQKAVLDLLARHVQIDENPDYIKRETFLIDELGISFMWINEAKAIKSLAMKRYGEAAWYLLQAEQWNRAHTVIIENLAADAIINENYDYLRSLLIPLVPPERHNLINGWTHQGQLLWDYMEIATEIEKFVKSADYVKIGYQLELLQPQLSSLCTKINQFPCPNAKLRLCQAEIAKRTLHLARTLLLMQPSEDKSTTRVLVHLVSQLPLPEDYAQQELRPLINMCVNEIIGH